MRAASGCGDGLMCKGGEEEQHGSTGPMNKLWTEIVEVGGDNAVWDAFHEFNYFDPLGD